MFDPNAYREAVSRLHASPETRRKIMNMQMTRKRGRRPLSAAAAAAVLVLAMTTAAFAAFHPSIQDWFAQKWRSVTGQAIGETQAAAIHSLTQKVGQSITVGDITVTLDSVTVGDHAVWALLRVNGLGAEDGDAYTFGDFTMEVDPAPKWTGAAGEEGWTIEEGVLTVLASCSACSSSDVEGARFNDGSHTLRLTLTDLFVGRAPGRELIQAGTWEFSVPLTQAGASPAVTVDRVQLDGRTLTGIRVTATDVSYTADQETPPAAVKLSDGTVIESKTNCMRVEDGYHYTLVWPVPLDMEKVASLCFDGAEVPLS